MAGMPPQFMKKPMVEGSKAEEAMDAKEGVVPANKKKKANPYAAAIARKMAAK